jgi:hypothetical protein
MLDERGRLVEADVTTGTTSVPGDVAGCGHLVTDAGATIPLQARTYDFPFWMSLGYFAEKRGSVTVKFGDIAKTVGVSTGLNTLFVRTEGSFDRVTLTPEEGVVMCVDPIKVGTLEARR